MNRITSGQNLPEPIIPNKRQAEQAGPDLRIDNHASCIYYSLYFTERAVRREDQDEPDGKSL
jgi:hypothetical protein